MYEDIGNWNNLKGGDIINGVRDLEERWMENNVREDGADEQFNSMNIGNF